MMSFIEAKSDKSFNDAFGVVDETMMARLTLGSGTYNLEVKPA